LARVKTLEREGFIKGYATIVDPLLIGLGLSVFVQVRLEKQINLAQQIFERAVADRPEIMECYLITGDGDYLLRLVVPDLGAYQKLLTDFIARIPGVGNIQSRIALKQVKHTTALPIRNEESS